MDRIPTENLQQAVVLSKEIDTLEEQLNSILTGTPAKPQGKKRGPKPKLGEGRVKGKRKMSAAGRANIVAAQKRRWAKIKRVK